MGFCRFSHGFGRLAPWPVCLLVACGGQSHRTVDAGGSTVNSYAAELSFYLIEAASGNDKQQIHHQDSVSKAVFGSDVTLLIKGPSTVKSVKFKLDGNTSYRLDNSAPFTLTGKDEPPFDALSLTVGSHILTTEAYSAAGGTGVMLESQSIVFTISDSP